MMDLFSISFVNFSFTRSKRTDASRFLGSHAVKYVGSARCDESTLYVVTRTEAPPPPEVIIVAIVLVRVVLIADPLVPLLLRVVAGIFFSDKREEVREDDRDIRDAIDAARIY
jgi:hypothetical protein